MREPTTAELLQVISGLLAAVERAARAAHALMIAAWLFAAVALVLLVALMVRS